MACLPVSRLHSASRCWPSASSPWWSPGPSSPTRSPRSVLGWRPPPPPRRPARLPADHHRRGVRGRHPGRHQRRPGAPYASAGRGAAHLRRRRSWSWARWTSAWVSPGVTFTQLIPSWNVATPASTAVIVQARVRTTRQPGRRLQDRRHRGPRATTRCSRARSGGPQRGPVVRVNTDTLKAAAGVPFNGYQLRVLPAAHSRAAPPPRSCKLRPGGGQPPGDAPARRPASALFGAKELAVPRYSQMTHRGQYPQYGGGGQAWCSPTSLSMILGYYKALPSEGQLRLGQASPTPTPGSTTSPASSTTTATRAPATGPSTRRTPPT